MGKVLVSACLLGIPCRMDGRSKPVEAVKRLYEEGLAVPACPEVLGGLPTPRPASEIVAGRVVNTQGEDVTEAFCLGARRALALCREQGCDRAILKSKSPSCGLGQIHNGRFDGGLVPGNGITAQLFLDEGILVMTEQDYARECEEPGTPDA